MRKSPLAVLTALLVAVLALAATGCGSDSSSSGSGSTSTDSAAAPAPTSPEDASWVYASGLTADGAADLGLSITFAERTVSGFGGCNRFSGKYTLDGQKLEMGQLAHTLIACPDPGDTVERAYLAALEKVAAWSIDGTELVLSDASGSELLRF